MGFVIGIILALLFLADTFPGVFGFFGDILSGAWNLIGTIVMFFVGILGKFLSLFAFVGDGFGWIMQKVGTLLSPVMEILPDSPFVPLALLLLLGILFLLLQRPGSNLAKNIDMYVKLTYGWCFAAFNLGMVIAGSGNPLVWMSGALDTYVTDFPMTLLNYAEWSGFGRTMLWITLIGGLIVSVIFAVTGGFRSFIRTWIGLAFCCTLGYGYMNVRLVLTDWFADNWGFIGKMLNIPIGFLEFIIIIQFFLGIVVFVLPMGAITAINEMNREKERESYKGKPRESKPAKPAWDDEEDDATSSYPTYVTDDEGNHYSVYIGGDFLYIDFPSGGHVSTKWEYVKGSPYFHINGKRFYPHS